MINVIAAMVLITSLSGQMLQDFDEQFRVEVLEILPVDYASVSTGLLFEDGATIADRIYSPHAEMLGEIALSEISSLSIADSDLLEGRVLRDMPRRLLSQGLSVRRNMAVEPWLKD